MIILDLDGCISDDRWRRKLIGIKPQGEEADMWSAYHAKASEDKAANLSLFKGRDDIIIVTGRPERYRPKTLIWLAEVVEPKGFRVADVIMRPNNDWDPAPKFKRKVAATLLSMDTYIESAYDDREDIVEQYRQLGIRAAVLKVEHDVAGRAA